MRMKGLREVLHTIVMNACGLYGKDRAWERQWTEVVLDEHGRVVSARQEIRIDPVFFAASYDCLAVGNKAMEYLLDVVRGDDRMSRILLSDNMGRGKCLVAEGNRLCIHWLTTALVDPFLKYYVRQAQSPAFDEVAFNAAFEVLSRDLAVNPDRRKWVCPLAGFGTEIGPVDFGPGLYLRYVTRVEIENWVNGTPSMLPYFPMTCPSVAIEYAQDVDPTTNETEQDQVALETCRRLLDVIRLDLCPSAYMVLVEKKSDFELVHPISRVTRPCGRIRIPVPEESNPIAADCASVVKKHYDRLVALPRESPVHLALKRFGSAVEEPELLDSLIDCWVALEALFTPDSTAELSYRASLRIATFVSKEPEARFDVFSVMHSSYKLRSAIVHGNWRQLAGLGRDASAQSLVRKTRGYLRIALQTVLDDPDKLDVSGIDERLLRCT